LNRSKRKKTQIGIVVSACLLLGTGAAVSRAATQGQVRQSAPPWRSLFGAAIRPDGSIYIVGSKALLLTSNNNGKTWTEQILEERPGSALFQDRDLYSLRFSPGGSAGWIVGEEGTILYSRDGGRTWTKQQSGTTKSLLKVAVLDAQTAVAVGADGTILRTTDGGAHWQLMKSHQMITFFDVTFTDKSTGFTVGEFSTILTTRDGGQTWTLAAGGNMDFRIGPFFTVTFTDPQNGIAAGLAGDLSLTSDGGKTWKAAKLPDQNATYVVSEDPATKKLWVGGAGGKMFVQSVGGQWQASPQATFHDLTDIAFSGKEGVAVGLHGTILLTQNAGERWQAVP